MNTTDKIMALVEKVCVEFRPFHLHKHDKSMHELREEIKALVRDAEELAFLKNDLLSWVDRAVEKGNANSDIQEASERYDKWLKTRHAAMQEKQS